MWSLESIILTVIVILIIVVVAYLLYKLKNPSVPNDVKNPKKFIGVASLSDVRTSPAWLNVVRGANSDPLVRVQNLGGPDKAEFDWFVLP